MKGQLHVHSTCSDGRLSPQEVADTYRHLGFDFIVFADHDHLLKPSYRQDIASVRSDMIVFQGVELTMSTRWGYVHVTRVEGDGEVLHIFNHPGDYGLSVKQTLECIEDVSKKLSLDAVEVTHQGFYTPEYDVAAIPYPKVATDDSHTSLGCGRAWIEMDCLRGKDQIIRQIKSGGFRCAYARSVGSKIVIA